MTYVSPTSFLRTRCCFEPNGWQRKEVPLTLPSAWRVAIPQIGSAGKGKPVVNLIQVTPGESVAAMIAVREFDEHRHVVLAAKSGYIKKTPLTAFSRPRAGGIIAVSIEEGDDLLAAGLTGGDDEIFMATAKGKSIRFKESDVRPMGRTAAGVGATPEPSQSVDLADESRTGSRIRDAPRATLGPPSPRISRCRSAPSSPPRRSLPRRPPSCPWRGCRGRARVP